MAQLESPPDEATARIIARIEENGNDVDSWIALISAIQKIDIAKVALARKDFFCSMIVIFSY